MTPSGIEPATFRFVAQHLNPLTPNDDYSGRTAPLTSKCCILYIYSTNISTEYIKHGIKSPFFPLQNAVCFINLTYLIPVFFTFYIQSVLKLKKNNSGAQRLTIVLPLPPKICPLLRCVSLFINVFIKAPKNRIYKDNSFQRRICP